MEYVSLSVASGGFYYDIYLIVYNPNELSLHIGHNGTSPWFGFWMLPVFER